jgi:hypothetical protein
MSFFVQPVPGQEAEGVVVGHSGTAPRAMSGR